MMNRDFDIILQRSHFGEYDTAIRLLVDVIYEQQEQINELQEQINELQERKEDNENP